VKEVDGRMRRNKIEPFNKRLGRFISREPGEIILTLINSIHNFLVPEIQVAKENRLTALIFLGAHAVMQTISEKVYGKKHLAGTRFFLENFVDGRTHDRCFSIIADELHLMRNVTAHQWLSRQGYQICIDYNILEGWIQDAKTLCINPGIFAEQFIKCFSAGSQIWDAWKHLPAQELSVRKYEYIRDFLHLKINDPIASAIRQLDARSTPSVFAQQEAKLKKIIEQRYGLT
jgi:hypothetical protein